MQLIDPPPTMHALSIVIPNYVIILKNWVTFHWVDIKNKINCSFCIRNYNYSIFNFIFTGQIIVRYQTVQIGKTCGTIRPTVGPTPQLWGGPTLWSNQVMAPRPRGARAGVRTCCGSSGSADGVHQTEGQDAHWKAPPTPAGWPTRVRILRWWWGTCRLCTKQSHPSDSIFVYLWIFKPNSKSIWSLLLFQKLSWYIFKQTKILDRIFEWFV